MGLPLGAIQVPPDGRPIVMLADRPVTGGYPVPAVVIGADIGRVARLRSGDELRPTPDEVRRTEGDALGWRRDRVVVGAVAHGVRRQGPDRAFSQAARPTKGVRVPWCSARFPGQPRWFCGRAYGG